MNTNYVSIGSVITALLLGGMRSEAISAYSAQAVSRELAAPNQLQLVAFRDRDEARMLRDAYQILATGNHDYQGHRVEAMHQIERAAASLGVGLQGDLENRQRQDLSDDRLRQARGLLQNVLGAAEVKNEQRIAGHVNEAMHQIDLALSIR
jgi:hypothetical protein